MQTIPRYNPGFLTDDQLVAAFVVREEECEQLLEALREPPASANPHRLVVGARGMGKTALIRRVAAELRRDPALAARWHPVVYPEESYLVSSAGEFWLEALRHLEDPEGRDWPAVYEALRREPDDQRLREAALAHLRDFADRLGKRLVLVVENLQMVLDEQLPADDAWTLRHTLLNEPRFMLLATAVQRPEALQAESYAFYELFDVLDLRPLPVEACRTLWQTVSGGELTDRQARAVQVLTGGNPRLLVILAGFAEGRSFRRLMEDLTALVDDHTDYFKSHLEAFRGKERRVFAALAERWNPASSAEVAEAARIPVSETSANLLRLVGKGAVQVYEKRGRVQFYQLSERLYNLYYLMRCRGGAQDRVRAVVDFMVALYDPEELATRLPEPAREACSGEEAETWAPGHLFEALFQALPDAHLRCLVLERVPPEFWNLDGAPRHLREEAPVPLAADAPGSGDGAPADLAAARRATELVQGSRLLKEGRYEAAERTAQRLVQTHPDDAGGWYLLGAALFLQDQDLPRAETCIRRALELAPEAGATWMALALILVKTSRRPEAREAARKAVGAPAAPPQAWGLLGALLEEDGEIAEAVGAYRNLVSARPELAKGWESLGRALLKAGAPSEAEPALERAVALDPGLAGAWVALGDLRYRARRLADAERAFRAAVGAAPDLADAHLRLGVLLLDREDLDAAEAAFLRASELEPGIPVAWEALGDVRSRKGNVAGAIEALQQAVRLDPSAAPAWGMLGSALLASGDDPDAAAECLHRAVALDPALPQAWYDLARTSASPGRLERLRCALEGVPRDAEILNTAAWGLYVGLPSLDAVRLAARWAEEALARASAGYRVNVAHTLACLRGVEDRWPEAWGLMDEVLDHREAVQGLLADVIRFFVLAAAAGQAGPALERLRASAARDLLEPMEAALAGLAGERPLPPQEVREMAEDILADVAQRAADLQRLRGEGAPAP